MIVITHEFPFLKSFGQIIWSPETTVRPPLLRDNDFLLSPHFENDASAHCRSLPIPIPFQLLLSTLFEIMVPVKGARASVQAHTPCTK